MITAVWVTLCVLGVATGFAVGWNRRHRRAQTDAATTKGANPASTTHAPKTTSAATATGTEGSAEDSAPAAPVIDLRVLPGQADTRAPAPDPRPDRSASHRGTASDPPDTTPRLSLAGTAVQDPPTSDHQRDAQVIDLAMASRQVPLHNLQFIDGIGPRLDKWLRANGIVTVTDLASARRKELRRIVSARLPGGDAAVDRLRTDARELVEAAERARVAPVDPGHELRQIEGVGTTMMRWLETQGITTLAQLAQLTKADIARLDDALSDYPGRIREEKWRRQARRLVD